ncbi:hypothetical protein ACFE04_007628 [Oxalis oulophora]
MTASSHSTAATEYLYLKFGNPPQNSHALILKLVSVGRLERAHRTSGYIIMYLRYRLFGGTILGTEDGICARIQTHLPMHPDCPRREGGWMEIEMGEFFDDSGDDGT